MCNITNIHVRTTQSLKCDKGSTVKHSQYNTGSTCTTQSILCNTGSTTRSKSKTQAIQYNTSNTGQHRQYSTTHPIQYNTGNTVQHIQYSATRSTPSSVSTHRNTGGITWSNEYNMVKTVQHGQTSTTWSKQYNTVSTEVSIDTVQSILQNRRHNTVKEYNTGNSEQHGQHSRQYDSLQ